MGKICAARQWSLSLLKEKIDVAIAIDMDEMVSADEDMVDEVHQGNINIKFNYNLKF